MRARHSPKSASIVNTTCFRENVDRVVGEFGPLDASTSGRGLSERESLPSRGRRRLPRDSIVRYGVVERIIARDDIPAATRIDALVPQAQDETRPECPSARMRLSTCRNFVQAVELDPMLAGHALAMTLEERLSRLDSIRDAGDSGRSRQGGDHRRTQVRSHA